MKPTSKKEQYTVKCENEEQTADVFNYMHNDNNRTWMHWHYVTILSDEIVYANNTNKYKYPIISFEEWVNLPNEPISFVFPEKWAIKITEDVKIQCNYYSAQGYHHSNNEWEMYIMEGFTEITIEQFKEYMLDEKQKDRKIIGYKLVQEEYEQAAVSICLGFKNSLYKFNDGTNFTENSIVHNKLKKAGVMHWFEPIFESKKITLKSGVEILESDIEEVKEILKNK